MTTTVASVKRFVVLPGVTTTMYDLAQIFLVDRRYDNCDFKLEDHYIEHDKYGCLMNEVAIVGITKRDNGEKMKSLAIEYYYDEAGEMKSLAVCIPQDMMVSL